QVVLVELQGKEVPLEAVAVPGHSLSHMVQQQLLGDDEKTHGGKIPLGGCQVHRQVGNLSCLVQLDGQIQPLLAVGNTGLGDHGNVLAAGNVGFQHLVQVDVVKDAGVSQHYIVVLAALFQVVRHRVEGVQLALVAGSVAGEVGVQEFQTALLQLQIPLL